MVYKKSVPTLHDVAKSSGVSIATVSRYINAPDSVAKPTQLRVKDAIAELGYTPDFAARVLASKRTYTIGAIIPTMENAIFARGLQAFQESLHELGYTLLVASSGYKPEREEEQILALIARGADALLLIGHDRAARVYDLLSARDVPALAAWSFAPDGRIPSVGFDNRTAMKGLTDEVLALGHRRIAVISGILSGNDRASERVKGIREAMAEFGLNAQALKIIETEYDIKKGGDALETLMAGTESPTAILCGNDVLAVGATKRAIKLGIRVPEDLSITGFDDIELAQTVSPALTTVHVPHREMGHRCAIELVKMVEQKSRGDSAELGTFIRYRETLAKNRSA